MAFGKASVNVRRSRLDDIPCSEFMANEVAAIVYETMPGIFNGVRPYVEFRQASIGTLGRVWSSGENKGRLWLYGERGQCYGVLAHELAHLTKDAMNELKACRRHHGYAFKKAQLAILEVMEDFLP